jgi:hypothetical protein
MLGLILGAAMLSKTAATDWLLDASSYKASASVDGQTATISNGLVRRSFHRGTTVSLLNQGSGEELLRAVGPEAVFVVDGKEVVLGGLEGQPDRAYLNPDWLPGMKPIAGSIPFVAATADRLPKSGLSSLALRYAGSGWEAVVTYQVYDGLPLITKKAELTNRTGREARIDRFELERLSVVEAESAVDPGTPWRKPNLTVLTDFSFAAMTMDAAQKAVVWEPEPEYTTQVNYELATPCRLSVRPPIGPGVVLKPGESFSTFQAFELLQDSTDRERQGLTLRKMYRKVAPWVSDNPIMLHLTSTDPKVVHEAIDQAADCGFEMVVISFWSGLDMEDVSPANLAKFKGFADYAHSKGLRLGGYSLLASRSIDKENDVVNPKPTFGQSPCLGSEWGLAYFEKLKGFLTETGFDLLEHDGSYPGDTCASTSHPGHRGLEDSQWTQYRTIADFYRWCREKGIYLNVPDNYFLAGSNKTGMGYRESNWSLPREQQHIHARQNLFDGTWEKTPSMGWMMVPLVEYQGGGPAATIEPLKDHLDDYGLHLANNFGYGAQACYRGPRLYDSPETRELVRKWVSWFKKHRAILESDVIHVSRADGKRLDTVLHANPNLKTKGMAVLYNPTDQELEQEIVLPLYYTGLKGRCRVSLNDGAWKEVTMDDQRRIVVKPKVPARSCVWFSIE